jgi:hypothetical protein
MKKASLILSLLLPFNAYCQTNLIIKNTDKLINWLIKKENIKLLNAKSDMSSFYNKDILNSQSILDEADKVNSNKYLKDFMNESEISMFNTAEMISIQTDWRIKYNFKVKYHTNEKDPKKNLTNYNQTIFSFSNPLFLNKQYTRAIIGKGFTCGIACGRSDLLLCELKNGKWNIIARANVSND